MIEKRNEPPNPKPGRGINVAERFYKKKPILFFAEIDPMKADYWLMDMERIFRIVECDEQQKVMCATDTLKGEAQNWWRSVIEEGAPTMWDTFTEKFEQKYFPSSLRVQKTQEFMNLK